MPSAATKLEKTVSPETMDPVKQVIGIVDKKVRNLEKRKLRLDSYRSKTEKGERLLDDQLEAVRRYDEVVQNLELAYELQKQFTAITNEAEKCLRKQMKREKLERQGVESERIRELLQLQGLLDSMGSPSARDDFLNGTNGAVMLSEDKLEQLDELYKLISPSRDGETSYAEQLDAARDHIVNYLESRDKEVAGTTYQALHELVASVNQCGYFDNPPPAAEEEEGEEVEGEEHAVAPSDEVVTECSAPADFSEVVGEDVMSEVAQGGFVETSQSVDRLVEPMTRLAAEPVDTSRPSDTSPHLAASGFAPEPVAVETSRPGVAYEDDLFFSTSVQFGQPRQLQEIVSSVQGSFDFLQESQIDLEPSHIDPAVVVAHQMAPSSIAMPHTEVSHVPAGFSASPMLSSDDPAVAQYSVSQPVDSSSTAAPYDSRSPAIEQQQQQQAYDHAFGVLQQQQFTQQASNLAAQMTSSASDVPQPIPLPNEALGGQPGFDNQDMMTADSQDKKPFAMNPNANIFRSMYSGGEQEDMSQSGGNMTSDGRSFSQLLQSQPDYQGSSGFAGSTYTRGGGGNNGRGGRSRGNRGNNVGGNYQRGGGVRGGYNQPRGSSAGGGGFGNGSRNGVSRAAPRGGGSSGGRGGRGNSGGNRGGYNRMAGGAPLQQQM